MKTNESITYEKAKEIALKLNPSIYRVDELPNAYWFIGHRVNVDSDYVTVMVLKKSGEVVELADYFKKHYVVSYANEMKEHDF